MTSLLRAVCLHRDLLALANAQRQHAPRSALPVFGGAAGLTITQGIKGIQVPLWLLCLQSLDLECLDPSLLRAL